MTTFTIAISGTKSYTVTVLRDGQEISRSEPLKRQQKALAFANRQAKHLTRWNPKANIILDNQTQGPF